MNKLLVGMALWASLPFSHAQSSQVFRPVVCFPVKIIIADLKNKFGEEMMLIGKHDQLDQVFTAVFVNQSTGSYTVIEMDQDVGCVISIGSDVHYKLPGTGV
jgi:hypothetical protein